MANPNKEEYLKELKLFLDKIKSVPNSAFNVYAKVNVLTVMNMRYERMAFNTKLDTHPYTLTGCIIRDCIKMFDQLMEIDFIQDDNSILQFSKSTEVVKKHEELWQEIWAPYNDEELQELINIRGKRLDANNLCPYFENKKCVDFGSGNGSFAFALIERGAATVTGIDFGAKQVARANSAAKSRGVVDRVSFSVGNVLKTDFPSDYFEFAVSNAVFHHLATKEDMELALQEVARVLKKGSSFWYFVHGSRAIGMDLWDMTVDALSEVDVQYMDKIIRLMNPGRGKLTYIIDLLTATYIHSTLEGTTEMLQRCGFGNVKRLKGADKTSYALDRVKSDPYGKEKFGTGELRLFCELIDK